MVKLKSDVNKKMKIVELSLEPDFYLKIDKKRKKLGFENIEQYFYSIARRDVFRKASTSTRPNEILGPAVIFGKKKIFSTKGKPFKI